MNKNRRSIFCLATLLCLLSTLGAAEIKPLGGIDLSRLTSETQVHKTGTDYGMRLAWWIPVEFWQATLSKNKQVSAESISEIVTTLSPYFMIAVVESDISPFGAMDFYPRDVILKNMLVDYTDGNGKKRTLRRVEKLDKDVELLQSQITPILSAAMGNMGKNIYFITYADRDRKNRRIISPYKPGKVHITLTNKKGEQPTTFLIETPLDSLFIPRTCANGKPAHVSWKYCPWDGSQLPE